MQIAVGACLDLVLKPFLFCRMSSDSFRSGKIISKWWEQNKAIHGSELAADMGGQLIKPPKSSNVQPSDNNQNQIRRRQERARDMPRDRNKYRSCPDIGGATPYKALSGDNNVNVNVKIYRSYGTLNEFWSQQMREQRPNVRIYRRSTGDMSDMYSVGSHVSLPPPRGQLLRSRSADRNHSTPNGLPRGLDLWKMKAASLDRGHDRVTTPSTTLSSTSARECKYTSLLKAFLHYQ